MLVAIASAISFDKIVNMSIVEVKDYKCVDSDGNMSLNESLLVRGETVLKRKGQVISEKKDICYNKKKIKEYYCLPSAKIGNLVVDCGINSSCVDGKCLIKNNNSVDDRLRFCAYDSCNPIGSCERPLLLVNCSDSRCNVGPCLKNESCDIRFKPNCVGIPELGNFASICEKGTWICKADNGKNYCGNGICDEYEVGFQPPVCDPVGAQDCTNALIYCPEDCKNNH